MREGEGGLGRDPEGGIRREGFRQGEGERERGGER